MAIDYISFAYAASVAAGGIIGYVKAGNFAYPTIFGTLFHRPLQIR